MNKVVTHEKSFFASCPVGIEELLLKELTQLGVTQTRVQRGGVDFSGEEGIAIKAVLFSRVASRIYKRLWSFDTDSEKDMYQKATALDWKTVLDLKQSFKIRTIFEHGAKSSGKFRNSMYASQVLKDALVDNFRTNFGERPDVNKEDPDVDLVLRLTQSMGSILLNICGEPLNQRGYRTETVEAPIKENLAAGIIMLSGWNSKNDPLIDSMCGSGTFCIEAAMLKADIPPSFLKIKDFLETGQKHWAFLNHIFFQNDAALKTFFTDEIKTTLEKSLQKIEELRFQDPSIFGFDIDTNSVNAAKTNLKTATLDNMVSINRGNASKITPPPSLKLKKGVILCNPPYGERIGATQELRMLYLEYGDNLKRNFRNWNAYVFTGNDYMSKLIPLKPSSRTKLFNGDIECSLIQYSLR